MNTLLVVQGPTGVGKTAVALQLAEWLGVPILNADSRQIYRDLPIGTAAPTAEEQRRAVHYFVGTLGLDDYWSAARYEQEALQLCAKLFAEHACLVLSGGSMLYVDAVCRGIDDIPTVDAETRQFLKERLEHEGLAPLQRELKLRDPDYYAQCDLKNGKRVVHALEICYMTGRPYSSFRTGQAHPRPFRIVKIGLRREREELYARINQRVDEMMRQGLLEEAHRVYPRRGLNALNTVGYKELFCYFDGTWSLEQAVEKIKQNTRIYSRKQMTWLRRDADLHWFSPDALWEIRNFITKQGLANN